MMLRTIEVSGVRYLVADEGTGPVILFVHGFPLDHTMWSSQIKEFSKTNRVIAPDLRGFGGTDGALYAVSMEQYADDLVGLLEALQADQPITFCGLSMGGGQAFYAGLESLDCFASVGVFSSGIFGGINNPSGKEFDAEKEIPGLLSNSQSFNQKLKLFYISVGEQDPRIEFTKKAVKKFQDSGLKVEFNSFPGDHEWQVWRKSLLDFASKVFK